MPIRTVTRSIDLAVDADRAWEAVGRPEGLAAWLGSSVELEADVAGLGAGSVAVVVDHGGRRRRAVVAERHEGAGLTFTWWDEAQPEHASTVRIEVEATADGSRVTVTETALPASSGGAGRASMSAAAVDHLHDLGAVWDDRLARLAGRVAPLPVAA